MDNRTDEATNVSMAKLSFWTIMLVAAVLLVSMILHYVGIATPIIVWLDAVASLIMFIVVSIVGWQNAKYRNWFFQILYFVAIAAILVSIILPRIF